MEHFIPTAGEVGILPMLVEFTFFSAYIAMGAAFVFFLVERNRVGRGHKLTVLISGLIVGVAAFHYFYMKGLYQPSLEQLAAAENLEEKKQIVKQTFLGIINFRYMDWLITTPLMLIKFPLLLNVKGKERTLMLITLAVADVFMIVTGYVGEQQLDAAGNVLTGARLTWGAISTVGYAVIVYVLLTKGRSLAGQSTDEVKSAFNTALLFVLIGWGIYPLGYMVPAFFPEANLNWVNLTYNIGDAVNKIGFGFAFYFAAMSMTAKEEPAGQVDQKTPVGASAQ